MALNETTLYNRFRTGKVFGPVLEPKEFEGIKRILDYAAMRNLPAAKVAYVLATVYHETGGLMQPIPERGGNAYFTRMYDITGARPALARKGGNTTPGDGIKYIGRGLAQITWKDGYKRVGNLIGVDLVNNPDLALVPEIAVKILVDGMIGGWFTGGSLGRYLPEGRKATRAEFEKSRYIINGVDHKDIIATTALFIQDDLIAGGWKL